MTEFDWTSERFAWNFCEENFFRLHKSFNLFGVTFCCFGFFDRQEYIALDFYTQQGLKEMTVLSATFPVINGKASEIKKCISFKPSPRIKWPKDLMMLCEKYSVKLEDVYLFERVEIFKKKEDVVSTIELSFHESGVFQRVIIL